MQPTCDLLLSGGIVVTMDPEDRVLDPGSVAITGDRVTAVGPATELSELTATRTLDCSGKIVLPGLIDCHNHLFQLLGRGLGEGMALWPWLCEFMWPYAAQITRSEAVAGARLGAAEAVRSGTTFVVDNHYAPADTATVLQVASAIQEVGLRGAVARGITGRMTDVASEHGLSEALFGYSAAEELEMTEACIRERLDQPVTVWPAPLNVIYVDQGLVAESVQLAHRYGTKWHTHCSEASADPDIYHDAYGLRPVEWLHREGLLDASATIAHAIWLDDAEVRAVGGDGAGVSYNPMSNQYLASGSMRLADLRCSGVVVGLGSDGSAGHRADMFQVMKQAVYVQRLATLDPEAATAQEVLELATREGARYAGIDAGQLRVGSLADVVVVDAQQQHLQPLHDPVAALVYCATGSDVETTIIGGRIAYHDRELTLVDGDGIREEGTARAGELAGRAGFASRLAPAVQFRQ